MAKSVLTTEIGDFLWALRLKRYAAFALAIIGWFGGGALFITAMVMTALRVFNWLRLGPGVYHWSALDALAYATGPDPWINNPTDWIGLWKLFNWFGGEVLLLAAAALVAIAGLSPLAHVDEIDAKIKARLAQKAPPPVG